MCWHCQVHGKDFLEQHPITIYQHPTVMTKTLLTFHGVTDEDEQSKVLARCKIGYRSHSIFRRYEFAVTADECPDEYITMHKRGYCGQQKKFIKDIMQANNDGDTKTQSHFLGDFPSRRDLEERLKNLVHDGENHRSFLSIDNNDSDEKVNLDEYMCLYVTRYRTLKPGCIYYNIWDAYLLEGLKSWGLSREQSKPYLYVWAQKPDLRRGQRKNVNHIVYYNNTTGCYLIEPPRT